MANHTLLDAVNEIFKRVNNIQGDASALTTLTDSSRQHPIDIAIQVINEGIDEIYSSSSVEKPLGQQEATITLATGTRSYALASDLQRLKFPLIDRVNTQFIIAAPGGYEYILLIDPEQTATGLPIWAAISPITGQLYMDRSPTSAENGHVYTYEYEKDLVLSASTDTVPFNNATFRSMVPAWVQLYKREMRNEFDQALYQMAIGRAARYVTEIEPRDSYNPRVKTTERWL